MKMYFDGMGHTLTGAFGTFTITAEAGNYARIEFDFTGQYYDPEDEALPSPTGQLDLGRQGTLVAGCASMSSAPLSPP